MDFVFNSCYELIELDISNFKTQNCESFIGMFTGVNDLKIIIKEEGNEKLIKEIPDNFELEKI